MTAAPTAAGPDTTRAGSPILTLRERQVVSLAALGLTNRAIAARLCLTEDGVKDAMRRVLSGLGVRNRVQAATVATLRGLLLPRDQLPPAPLVHVAPARINRVAKRDLRAVVDRWRGRAPEVLLDELQQLCEQEAS